MGNVGGVYAYSGRDAYVGQPERPCLTADELDCRLSRWLEGNSPSDTVGYGRVAELQGVLRRDGLKAAKDFAVATFSQLIGTAAYSFLKNAGLLP